MSEHLSRMSAEELRQLQEAALKYVDQVAREHARDVGAAETLNALSASDSMLSDFLNLARQDVQLAERVLSQSVRSTVATSAASCIQQELQRRAGPNN